MPSLGATARVHVTTQFAGYRLELTVRVHSAERWRDGAFRGVPRSAVACERPAHVSGRSPCGL